MSIAKTVGGLFERMFGFIERIIHRIIYLFINEKSKITLAIRNYYNESGIEEPPWLDIPPPDPFFEDEEHERQLQLQLQEEQFAGIVGEPGEPNAEGEREEFTSYRPVSGSPVSPSPHNTSRLPSPSLSPAPSPTAPHYSYHSRSPSPSRNRKRT